MSKKNAYVYDLSDLGNDDVAFVGGKNASLGEMIQTLGKEGAKVPGGFATTAQAYREFLGQNELSKTLGEEIDSVHNGDQSLETTNENIRTFFRNSIIPVMRKLYGEEGHSQSH